MKNGLIYGLNERPPLKDALFAALQHLLAIFVAIITPPLIISAALGFDIETTSTLVSMSLFVSGIATFVQCRKFGIAGCGLMCVQGTSFSFISPIILAGSIGGLPAIFGATMVGALAEIFISRILRYAMKIITPLVSGIVVTLIGISLIKVGIISCGGGSEAIENGTFGSFQNLGIALLVLILIIIFNKSSNRYIRMGSVIIGIVVGYMISYFCGMVDFDDMPQYSIFCFPVPFKYGISFNFSAILAFALVYIITAIEAYGDITANSIISGEPVAGEKFIKRAQGGIFADGFNSVIAGMLNSFPNSIFAQNNGMIQLTGVASRYVGYYIALFLVLLGFFPIVGVVFSFMPDPVLGGAALLMFGTVASAGVKIISSQRIDRKATLIIAISLGMGVGVELYPDILSQFSDTIKDIFSSGITTGGLAAIISNMVIKIKE